MKLIVLSRLICVFVLVLAALALSTACSGGGSLNGDPALRTTDAAGGGGGGMGGPQCITCHPTPPERPGKEWKDAPGPHGNCNVCHGHEHGDSPDPPDSICLKCHEGRWSKSHQPTETQCLSCHLWPHVPTTIQIVNGIHEDHSGIVGCWSCHKMHGGGLFPDRTVCLSCHPSYDEHSDGLQCRLCHKS